MRLIRLRVSELRQFRAPFELADIQPGLNIFTGANEAGKSTLVRAIRAAFFERHRSTSVDDLRPYGDSAAAPLVELDFEIDGTNYRLTKSFLQKKRCELIIGSRRLEGVEAEDALAERLGFEFALKGASREQHWGIPGLLWIEQGSAQAVRDAVAHAADHLRRALDESLGEMSSSGGDDLLGRVRELRDELLTGTGKPRAEYAKALAGAEDLAQRVENLRRDVALYQGEVDQLRQLREDHRTDTQAQPWIALRDQHAKAVQALQAAQALAEARRHAQEHLAQVAGIRELLTQQLAAAEQKRQDLSARESALASELAGHEQASLLEARAVQLDAEAASALHAAREALTVAKQEDTRAQLARQAADAQARASELATVLAAAAAEHERAAASRQEAARLRVDPADLAVLRQQDGRLAELRIRQEAVATRLRFDLDAGVVVDLAGEAVAGQAERLLVTQAMLSVPGIGRIQVSPGGTDLAELAQEQANLQHQQAALLQRLGLPSLVEAEIRQQAHAQRTADAEAAEKARKLLAPKGLDALAAERNAAQARAAQAAGALGQLPPPPTAAVLPLEAAERAHETARVASERSGHEMQAARQALIAAAGRVEAARRERDALKATLESPSFQADLVAKQRDRVDAGARETEIRSKLSELEGRIAQARPDILEQDVQRFRRSAEESERQYHARGIQIAQLEATLAAKGGQGLEEDLAQAQSASLQAQRRASELRRRAEALDFLLARLEQRRQALVRRLQAPLQKHLDHYLQLLFPSGRLEVDEGLVPGTLVREGPRGLESGDFDTLSFGAREQMGVVSRLAYADLLREAGRPTMIILDDALVHSDEQRLVQMKRLLFDAAQRHQMLLFTCHPAHWRDMGVPLRSLDSR